MSLNLPEAEAHRMMKVVKVRSTQRTSLRAGSLLKGPVKVIDKWAVES